MYKEIKGQMIFLEELQLCSVFSCSLNQTVTQGELRVTFYNEGETKNNIFTMREKQ